MDCDIQSIIFDGPEEKLKMTEYTQPAIYIVSAIIGYYSIIAIYKYKAFKRVKRWK